PRAPGRNPLMLIGPSYTIIIKGPQLQITENPRNLNQISQFQDRNTRTKNPKKKFLNHNSKLYNHSSRIIL
ncbi:hypothetical protein VIGAN_10140100, partial [Vigna angularis var. angularis]